MTNHEKAAKAFDQLLIAGMLDAAIERKMTQFKTSIVPSGRTKPELIRIIVVPETMDYEWAKPLETE